MVSELRPLLPQNDTLVLRRTPKRADPDQPAPLSLASAGGRNLNACACFLGSTRRGDQGLSYDVLWALLYSDNLSTFTLLKQIAQIPQNLLLARVKHACKQLKLTLLHKHRYTKSDSEITAIEINHTSTKCDLFYVANHEITIASFGFSARCT
jgi:hypothetical protein